MSDKRSNPTDATEIEAQMPPLSRSYGTVANILRGTDAKLEALKLLLHQNRDSDEERPSKARKVEGSDGGFWARRRPLDGLDRNKEALLFMLPIISINLMIDGESVDEAEGLVLVTTHRILFIAADESQDIAIDAICVTLHAMTSEPDISVYCQLSSNSLRDISWKSSTAVVDDVGEVIDTKDGESDDPLSTSSSPSDGPIEVFFTPKVRNYTGNNKEIDDLKSKLCEEFFRALGSLVALNPIYDEEEENMYDAGCFDVSETFMTKDDSMEGGDDFICRLNSQDDEQGGATDEERNAMLARLDSILTVPAEYDGQFDDADESETLL